MITLKSSREIALMKEAGKVVAKVFETVGPLIKPGISTFEINEIAEKVITENGCTGPCKGYYEYPAMTCVSVNNVLIHGIPTKKIILKEGDIVSLDVVANYKGYCADATRTFEVGVCSEKTKQLVRVTRESFFEAIKYFQVGYHVGDISHAIEAYVNKFGYSVTRDATGHGIGSSMHEDPAVPCYGNEGTGPAIKVGMALAIEPMVLEGKYQTRILPDGWTTVSKDGKLTCHYENTVVLTEEGLKIITLTEEESKELKQYV